VRLYAVRIQNQRALEARTRASTVTGAQQCTAERKMKLRVLGIRRNRLPDQVERLVAIAALVAQDAEQVQRVGIAGLGEQMFTIGLFGGVELAALVQFKGFLQDHFGQTGKVQHVIRPSIMP